MIPFPKKKYNIIYADPAWHFQNYNNANAQTNPENHYKTMTMKEIEDLPVNDIADKDCVLFMWCTDPLLHKQIPIVEKWGFTYKSINIVRSSIDKVQFVKQNPCDLFIDDFSKGQEYGNSYEVLYTDTINQLNSMGINLEVFKNNWLELTEKYIED